MLRNTIYNSMGKEADDKGSTRVRKRHRGIDDFILVHVVHM